MSVGSTFPRTRGKNARLFFVSRLESRDFILGIDVVNWSKFLPEVGKMRSNSIPG